MKYGFIGAGNMGSAIISGILNNDANKTIYAYDIDQNKINSLPKKVKCLNLKDLIKQSDIVVLAVKPQMMNDVLKDINNYDLNNKLFISIAAGLNCEYFEKILNKVHIVRAMPNINAVYGEAITALCKGKYATNKDLKNAKEIFESVGETIELQERLIPAFSAIAGASPAYTFMYADALALAAVEAGIPRDIAIRVAAQSIKGSAVTLLESNTHPDVLRDRVCSPCRHDNRGSKGS